MQKDEAYSHCNKKDSYNYRGFQLKWHFFKRENWKVDPKSASMFLVLYFDNNFKGSQKELISNSFLLNWLRNGEASNFEAICIVKTNIFSHFEVWLLAISKLVQEMLKQSFSCWEKKRRDIVSRLKFRYFQFCDILGYLFIIRIK